MKFIDENATAVLKSSKFLEVDPDLLSKILARDGLSAKEIDIYAAAVAWAKAELQRKAGCVLRPSKSEQNYFFSFLANF